MQPPFTRTAVISKIIGDPQHAAGLDAGSNAEHVQRLKFDFADPGPEKRIFQKPAVPARSPQKHSGLDGIRQTTSKNSQKLS
jgi:hypothetical protein